MHLEHQEVKHLACWSQPALELRETLFLLRVGKTMSNQGAPCLTGGVSYPGITTCHIWT